MSSKTLSSIFIKKVIDEFKENEKDISISVIEPLMDKIYKKIHHYLYFIFIVLLVLLILSIMNFVIITYHIRKNNNF
jgi:sensor histidine kinase regulating citrate/malate metabolism